MDLHDLNRPPTTAEIIDEWSETKPDIIPKNSEDWSMMVARRMARLPKERLARRLYYDLFSFRCR